jgi:acetylornithine deacetylase
MNFDNFDPIHLLRKLVSIPSVNPMGRNDLGPEFYEERLTDFLQSCFESLKVPWQRHQVAPRRDNILAKLPSPKPDADYLVLEAHQDTVPVEGMTIAPWDPEIREGRVYGRGSCDIKGGMACMLSVFARLARERPDNMPNIVMACTVNEENGFTGAKALAEFWTRGDNDFMPGPPDAVVVAEPTSLDVVVAHKGVVRWRCVTVGQAAHSSCPEDGENAIYHMARVLAALEEYAGQLAQADQHPRVGQPTLSVGTINGGISVNTVPDRCSIEIDRRLLPNEDPKQAREAVIEFLDQRLPAETQLLHEEPFIHSQGLSDQHNGDLATVLSGVIRQHGAAGKHIGVPYGTDAPAFAALNIPAVIFGPGSIAQAHTASEWVPIDEVRSATEILHAFSNAWSLVRGR